MRINLECLDDVQKLEYAVECMECDTPFPNVITDFLLQHGLYELVTKPKAKYDPNSESNTTS